jgi:pyruvate,water dikinase
MSIQWVLKFEQINQENAAQAGKKCANLGEMMRLGLPVPPGFVITTDAFDFFLKETGAGDEINQQLAAFDQDTESIEAYRDLSQRLGHIVTAKDIPAQLQNSIFQAYEALSTSCNEVDVPTAVRSSGGAEDLPTAAFAGQYESYLNISGNQNLLDKTKACWASLFTARALSYRHKNELPITDTLMAVIVQRVVKARSAGVAFTALPTTGDPAWVMMEGNWGTAESVVQGSVMPDKCFVSKETLTVEEMRVSQKLTQFSLDGAGTKEETIPAHLQSAPCFSKEEAAKIAELAVQVESHYGMPQDIEWVIEHDLPFPENIFLVQTRPITALQRKSAIDQVADLMLTRFIKR